MSKPKPIPPQTAPNAIKTVPPQLAKVATTGPGTVGLVTGTAVNVEAKPTGMTVGGNKK
jgi:hypothetical protein